MSLFKDLKWSSSIDGSDLEYTPPADLDLTNAAVNPDDSEQPPVENDTEDGVLQVSEDGNDVDNSTETIEPPQDEDTFSYKAIVESFQSKGLLDFDSEKEYEDNEDLLFESLEYTVNKRIEEKEKSKYSEKGLELLKHLEAGGTPDSFLQIEKIVDYSQYSLENVDNQKGFVAEHLTFQGYTPEEIDEEIKTLEDLGAEKLLKKAQVAQRFLVKEQETEKHRILQEEVTKKEQIKAQEINTIKSLETTILTIDKIAGLTPSKEDREAFKDYLLKKDRNGKTQYQKEVESEKNAAIDMAFLKFKKYNTDADKKAVTKVTTDLRKKLSNYKDTNTAVSSGKQIRQEPENVKVKYPSFFDGIN